MLLSQVTFGQCEPLWQTSLQGELKNSVDIWKISRIQDTTAFKELKSVLNKEELQKASRFHQEKDRESFIIRRGALRILLGRYLSIQASEIEFLVGVNKKPLIKQEKIPQIHYNVSHSGDLILIAIADHPVGVDIEKVNPAFLIEEVLQQAFSQPEITFIRQSAAPITCFFNLWTRKEALIKATSKGLDDDLPEIPCLDGAHRLRSTLLGSEADWKVSSFRLNEEYEGSIAYYPMLKTGFFNPELNSLI